MIPSGRGGASEFAEEARTPDWGSGHHAVDGARGASNATAKRDLGWTLRYSSWRQGFVAAYASGTPTDGLTFDQPTRSGYTPS
jgi:hypothetical protein